MEWKIYGIEVRGLYGHIVNLKIKQLLAFHKVEISRSHHEEVSCYGFHNLELKMFFPNFETNEISPLSPFLHYVGFLPGYAMLHLKI